MEGVLGSTFEECKVESSAYECIGLNVTEMRSLCSSEIIDNISAHTAVHFIYSKSIHLLNL